MKDTARYTAARRPVRFVYAEECPTIEAAKTRERQVRGWTRIKKEALVSKDASRLKGIVKKLRKRRPGF